MKPEGIPRLKDIQLSECEISDGRLYFQGRLYVPDNELRLLVLGLAHDLPEAGHPGKNRLYNLVSRHYWWPNLHKATAIYATGCHSCRRVTNSRSKYQGTLKPLPVPLQRWRNITVDFVGPLPASSKDRFDMMMVTCDRLSKGIHISNVHSKMTATELAKVFVKDVWHAHSLPDSIVSDQGVLFVSELWRAINHCLRTNLDLRSSYHPESDSQIKRYCHRWQEHRHWYNAMKT